MRRAIAIVVSLSLCLGLPTVAIAGDPIVESTSSAPSSYARVGWKNPDLSVSPGYWYSQAQIVKVSARLDYLETRAAKECVDAQVIAAKGTTPWLMVIGGIVTGVAIGYCAGASGHCGIGK